MLERFLISMGLYKNVVISWKLRQTRLGIISIFRLQMLDKIFSFPLITKLIDSFEKQTYRCILT